MSMRGAARGLWPLLLGLGLLAGMFMMHGISATPSPVHVSAPVVSSFPAEPHAGSVPMQPVQAMQAVHGSPGSHDAERAGLGHGGAHEAGCGAGAVCFALLVAFVLLLVRGRGGGPLLALPPVRPVPLPSPGRPRARPPSVYQLSVLRL